jgi:hypothetical protein
VLEREDSMKIPASFFPIAFAVGVTTLTPGLVRAQDSRQEGPIEIEKCQTIDKSGSYKLVRNLTFTVSPTGGSCLPITASFVTIDLAGFSISLVGGSMFSGGSGISAASLSGGTVTGITVRNGSILGVGGGLQLLTVGVNLGSESIVEGLHVSGLGSEGISATGIVRGNTVGNISGGPGQGVGIVATGIVTGNYVTAARVAGYEIGRGSTVIGNTAVNNFGPPGAVGLSVDCPSNVTDNTAVNNNGADLVLNGEGCNNTNNVAP